MREARISAKERLRTRATILNNVEYRIANRDSKKTKELMKNAVYNKFLGFIVFYKIVLEKNETCEIGYYLTRRMMQTGGISGTTLEYAAHKNTKKNKFCLNLNEERNMIILTNEAKRNGANVLLFKKVIAEAAKKLDADIYILPSSVHEVIVVSASKFDKRTRELKELLSFINDYVVEDTRELLSYDIYKYEREKGYLGIVNIE